MISFFFIESRIIKKNKPKKDPHNVCLYFKNRNTDRVFMIVTLKIKIKQKEKKKRREQKKM